MSVCTTKLTSSYDSPIYERDEPLLIEYSWKGVIEEVEGSSFYAKLYDPQLDRFGEIEHSINDIEPHNVKFVEKGSAFILLLYVDQSLRKKYKFEFLKYRPPFDSYEDIPNL